ncbi:MAG TPA: hypothetical protein VFW02_04435 [Candidatus Limnocylindrales bacterium]|nr:hypothetical protein [Candidatus Limnocylindrales bacterium]
MTDPTPDPPRPEPGTEPPRIPGERRLAHPPSDRYREVEPPPAVEDPAASPARGVAVGIVAAIAGAAAITLLGGLLAMTSGLLVAAGATGWAVGIALRAGATGRLPAGRRAQLAVILAVLAVVLGQIGLWAYARSEGGVLDPVGYLAEVFGWLVPLELLAAGVVAWATAR